MTNVRQKIKPLRDALVSDTVQRTDGIDLRTRDLARTRRLYWPALFVQLFISILVNSKKNYLPKKSILIVIVGYLSGINCRQRHAELT